MHCPATAPALAMTVQANWRLVFRFEGGNVELLDYLDYH